MLSGTSQILRGQNKEMGKCCSTWKVIHLKLKHLINYQVHNMFPTTGTALIVPTYRKRNRRIRLCVSMYNTFPVSGSMTGSRWMRLCISVRIASNNDAPGEMLTRGITWFFRTSVNSTVNSITGCWPCYYLYFKKICFMPFKSYTWSHKYWWKVNWQSLSKQNPKH